MNASEKRIARKRASILATMADLERRPHGQDFDAEMAMLRENLAALESGEGLLGHFLRAAADCHE